MTSRIRLGTISAGAEMLMVLDLAPTEVKRLAANIRRAAGRMRDLLADLAGARQRDNGVLIVEDTGPGIPRAIQDRLFEPFVTAGKNDGLGLGLALSRQTVLDHGGDMWIEPAAGAHFTIRLPLKRDEVVL